ncbi:sulfatase-like hydrolase/transferase [Cerasicoccus frondis]|uniref:sulfatase-like hydrolase/transferase n=1 Tax=Cerasicoccus frondis TaxID=490090 RepID=UPI0028528F38|nr:sulfatase-like hydrolase/transferase [Cerasicoccus frondis]
MSRLPNIVLTIADDQRGDALGFAGIEPVLTPALDALAARGTHYAAAQHFGSCHGAICSPSRAMLHTGQTYFDLDSRLLGETYHTDGEPEVPPLLGEQLQSIGYDCFATGKWHNGVTSFQRSFNQGENIFFGGMADHWFTPMHDFDSAGRYPVGRAKITNGFSTEVFAQSAIDFIHSQKEQSRPFFCYCAFTAPHDPRTPPDFWRRQYAPEQIQLSSNIEVSQWRRCSPSGAVPLFDNGSLSMRDELLLGVPRDKMELQRSIAEYYAMISHMDECIGKIHDAIASIGELDNTIIIHTADHGLAVGQHGLLGKQNLYQHSLRVPLIWAGPDIEAGATSTSLCYQHDLNPTLLERVGLKSDCSFFQPLDSQPRTEITAGFSDSQRTIRDQNLKLIEYNYNASRKTQLFNLIDDPWETNNLFNGIVTTDVNRLRTSLIESRSLIGDDSAHWLIEKPRDVQHAPLA